MQNKIGGNSFFTPKGESVQKIHVKSKENKNDLGLAGFFWIKDGKSFCKMTEDIKHKIIGSEREIIADDIIMTAINKGFKIGYELLNQYIHLGSVYELSEYLYWLEGIKNLNKIL